MTIYYDTSDEGRKIRDRLEQQTDIRGVVNCLVELKDMRGFAVQCSEPRYRLLAEPDDELPVRWNGTIWFGVGMPRAISLRAESPILDILSDFVGSKGMAFVRCRGRTFCITHPARGDTRQAMSASFTEVKNALEVD